jgi:predicted deacylase
MQSKSKAVREPIGGEAEPSPIAGTLVELGDGKVATEDKVATVLDRLQGVVAAEIDGLAVMARKLRAYHPGRVIELLTKAGGR